MKHDALAVRRSGASLAPSRADQQIGVFRPIYRSPCALDHEKKTIFTVTPTG